jgi:hypothetical protein
MFVPSPDAPFASAANTYGRNEPRREERAMGVMDLEVQRERRMEMLREAENRHVGSRRSGRGARAFSKLASFLAIVR